MMNVSDQEIHIILNGKEMDKSERGGGRCDKEDGKEKKQKICNFQKVKITKRNAL